MVDPATTQRLAHRALYLALTSIILFLRLLPISPGTGGLPGPDLTMCLTLVWIMRRPDYVPAWLIVLVFLLEDVMMMRPPGLWPLIVLGGTEFLRSREAGMRDLPFLLELSVVAVTLAGMVVVNRMVLSLTMVPQPALGQVLVQLIATLIAYPVIALVSHRALGLRRAAPGEVDAMGQRL